ncbi:hypothetical protein N7466_007387 [Penicillium verhagenii]|uniref:uncharacterized protein n=1 Tax=Penicillium verhagenii TaxID=1562060 RepID=UPI00254540AC|nr:uncharacterized protein N7466_007387 [Penicillium verhagenii]KAJ5928431.1 hypothetical protein N7466_007387 [Penicillium verhagenii]
MSWSQTHMSFVANDVCIRIVCSICKQLHSQGDYSDPQLASLIDKIDRVGLSALVNQSSAKCNGCCGSPNLEYKCRFCRCWKAIECFARNQRPLAEPACKDCQDGVQGSAQPWRSKEQKMIEDAARAKQEQELSQRLGELAANPLQLAVVPRALQWEDPSDVKDWSELVDLHGLLKSGVPQEKEKSMIRRVRLLAQRLRRNQATREEQRLEVARTKVDVEDEEKPAFRKIQVSICDE